MKNPFSASFGMTRLLTLLRYPTAQPCSLFHHFPACLYSFSLVAYLTYVLVLVLEIEATLTDKRLRFMTVIKSSLFCC